MPLASAKKSVPRPKGVVFDSSRVSRTLETLKRRLEDAHVQSEGMREQMQRDTAVITKAHERAKKRIAKRLGGRFVDTSIHAKLPGTQTRGRGLGTLGIEQSPAFSSPVGRPRREYDDDDASDSRSDTETYDDDILLGRAGAACQQQYQEASEDQADPQSVDRFGFSPEAR
ncbi:unnamed protein product, partial [Amoebophrya sp. A25]|eukprot:GSA25T00013897001.1